MEYEFITVKGIRLAYVDKNPLAQQTIFFVHGNSVTSDTWQKQLNDPLFSHYRMIAIDLPGHGLSESSQNPLADYSIKGLGYLMAAALQQLLKSDFILAAVSLGTNILVEMLPHLPKPKGIVLAGSNVFGGAYDMARMTLAGFDGSVLFDDAPAEEKVVNLANKISFSFNEKEKEKFILDFLSVKKPFRSTVLKTFMAGEISDEIAILVQQKIPVMLVFGANENVVQPNYLNDAPFFVWRNQVFKLPLAGHFVQWDQSVEFNNLLLEYCQDRFITNHSS